MVCPGQGEKRENHLCLSPEVCTHTQEAVGLQLACKYGSGLNITLVWVERSAMYRPEHFVFGDGK